ncbi:hypothetical protein [Methylovulum psychrotolerans]|uniref:hypothetical protein n=1 Tax=Methylovulum psychrotolerans TaxID=1704499 RepID=UPI000CDEE02F|nr:hypothetical protein [Methylovulum psychrotolerans]
MYLFDVLTNDGTGISSIQYTLRILTDNWDKAKKEAELQAKSEFGNLFILTPIGVEFYHQAY